MKRGLLFLVMVCTVLTGHAQVTEDGSNVQRSTFNVQRLFGYLSYAEALQSMPQYAIVQQQMTALHNQYQAETKRVEEEFNRKYEDFLEGQREFPKTILQKRQTELQELMMKNIAFKDNSRKELAAAEQQALAPLKARLAEVIGQIASERGLALVVNTDSEACPYINPDWGESIDQLVQDALQ